MSKTNTAKSFPCDKDAFATEIIQEDSRRAQRRDKSFLREQKRRKNRETKKERREEQIKKNCRAQLIETLSGTCEIKKAILRMHMDYNRGRSIDKPTIIDDIEFYRVGHNASHEFYAGVKEGQRYVYTTGEEGYSEEDGPIYEENIYPVEQWGYLGHY